jgi:hypothetical protein
MSKLSPDDLRKRMTGLAPGERPRMPGWAAFLFAAFLRVGYRRRRTAL